MMIRTIYGHGSVLSRYLNATSYPATISKKKNKKNTLCSSVFGLETFKGLCRKEMGGLGVQIYDLAIDEHTII